MKILLLAPHPFYQERGTPIAVNLLVQSLSEAGHSVDVLCFPEGSDVQYPNVRIHRTWCFGFLKGIRPGLSWKKVILDSFMFFQSIALAARIKPDIVHAVEESVLIGRALRTLLGLPYLYDMDSSIPDQIIEKYPRAAWLQKLMHRTLGLAAAGALLVTPVCEALADVAEENYRPKRVFVLHDVSLLKRRVAPLPLSLRERLHVSGTTFMYAGNLEGYQGVDLLLDAFALHLLARPADALVIVGGTPAHIAKYRAMAAAGGVDKRVHFLGPQPSDQLGDYFHEADVLVSPRIKGENTPMKIYSYLDSGRAVLATRLFTHTQVLDDGTACLADPDPRSFASAMTRLSMDAEYRWRLGAAGRQLVQTKYSYDVFRKKVDDIYAYVSAQIQPAAERPMASDAPKAAG